MNKDEVIKDFNKFIKSNEDEIVRSSKHYGCVYLTLLEYDEELTEVNIELSESFVITLPLPKSIIGEYSDYEWRHKLKDLLKNQLSVDVILDGLEWDALCSIENPMDAYLHHLKLPNLSIEYIIENDLHL